MTGLFAVGNVVKVTGLVVVVHVVKVTDLVVVVKIYGKKGKKEEREENRN